MASEDGIEADGLKVGAEEVIRGQNEENEDDSGEDEDEDEDTDSSEEETESDDDESESESASHTESDSDSQESETETDSESEMEATAKETEATESEATETETERSTGMEDDTHPRPLPLAEEDYQLLPRSPADLGTESLALMQTENDAQPQNVQAMDDVPVAHALWSLPPAPSRSGSREGIPLHQTQRAEDTRPSSADASQEGQAETTTYSLPPAVYRSSSRECSRRSSHLEASTSGSALHQSSSSLPPINLRSSSSQQPSRKGSSSSQGPAKSIQMSSPKQGSPPRYTAPRYWQPPPQPPPPPKPKPRERHDTSAVDPVFLQTAVYRTVPNVGRVYDWQVQHEVNAALSKQRKQQVQMGKVLEAARVQLQVRESNERAFQQWMASKEQEKQQQSQHSRRIAYVTSVYRSLLKEDPIECKAREALWVSNFACPSSGDIPARGLTRTSEDAERFRL